MSSGQRESSSFPRVLVWREEGDSTTPKMLTGRAKSNQMQTLFANPDSERALSSPCSRMDKKATKHTHRSVKMILQNTIPMTQREKKHTFKNVY